MHAKKFKNNPNLPEYLILQIVRKARFDQMNTKQGAEIGLKAFKPAAKLGIRTRNSSLVQRMMGKPGCSQALVERIRSGLPAAVVVELELAFEVPRRQIAVVLDISLTTLNRLIKTGGRLSSVQSDRVIRIARLRDAAFLLMEGDEQAAIQWVKSPLVILGNETPLQHSDTEMGAREVEDLIGRIRHGVFS